MNAGYLTFDDIAIGRTQRLERTITADDVDAFGQLSGDTNPLHMDERFASGTPFGRRVVHGLFTGGLVSTAHTRLTGPGFVYVGQELKFHGPVFIGDTLTVDVTVVGKKEAKRILVMETTVTNQRGAAVLSGSSALKELELS